jgi:sugar phosphate isomerase/epimerase
MLPNQIVLTVSGAEISPSLDRQLEILGALEINHIEIRTLKNTPLSSIRACHVKSARKTIDKAGFTVSTIASCIGKVGLDAPLDQHLNELKRIQDAADTLGTRMIRVFSFYPDAWGNLLNRRDQVIDRMNALTDQAASRNHVLLLENAPRVYGETPDRCLDLLETVGSPHLRMSFDIGNFVRVNASPLSHAYPMLESHVDYVQVKDARRDPTGSCRIVLAGEGDGQVRDLLGALCRRQRPAYIAIDPRGGRMAPTLTAGTEAMDLCRQAVQAVRNILQRVNHSRKPRPQPVT